MKSLCLYKITQTLLFPQAKEAQPPIEAFFPKAVYSDESEVELKNLEDAVESWDVCDSILIYKLLTARGVGISDDLKQKILELVCFYNNKDPVSLDLFEKRGALEAKKRDREAVAETWEENSFAEQLFESIEQKTPSAYNTLIRGLYKFKKNQRAEDIFIEAKEKQIPLDLATYNIHIRNISKPGLTADLRWDRVKTVLSELNNLRIKPNIHTLNAILSTIKNGGNIFMIQKYAVQVIAEFKALNIEPSLESYSHLLDIFHAKQSPPCNVLQHIVDRLEKITDLKAHSSEDLSFFYKAMIVCRFRLVDCASLAHRIDNLLTHSDNIKLIGDAQQEQSYYRYFLSTLLHNETFDQFINIYDQLVPESYALEPSVADDIFSHININGCIEQIPKFWTDMVISGISKRSQLNDSILVLMTSNKPVSDVVEHHGLTEQFGDIGWAIYQDAIAEKVGGTKQEITIPATRLSHIIILLLRADRYDDAKTIVEKCIEKQKERVIGCLTDECLSEFMSSCIKNKEPRIAIRCVAYSIENGIGDPFVYGQKIVKSFTLDSREIKRITDLCGKDVLQPV